MNRYIISLFVFLIIGGVVKAQQPVVKVFPAEMYLELSDVGEIFVEVENIDGCKAYSIHLTYNSQKVRCLNVTRGNFFSSWNTFFFSSVDSNSNLIMVDEAILGLGYQSGSGDLFKVQLLGLNEGDVNLNFEVADFRDTLNNLIPVQTENGVVHIVNPTSVEELKADEEINSIIAYPNPFNSSTRIKYTPISKEETELAIYSVLGEKVFSMDPNSLSGNSISFIWNSRDMDGNILPSGIYLLTVETKNDRKSFKLIILK